VVHKVHTLHRTLQKPACVALELVSNVEIHAKVSLNVAGQPRWYINYTRYTQVTTSIKLRKTEYLELIPLL
jgi:hypothetical protein